MDLRATSDAIRGLVDNVERVITGKRRAVELACITLFSGEHLLIEDVPGVGKTMLARAMARSIDGTFKRVQGTSDLMPADVTGTSIFDQSTGRFAFVPGPVFCNILLVDEINRATPKTQSALLEVMAERSVSADGDLHDVPRPFFVAATRNPLEHHGTFPLPEGELDRFGLSIGIGYPDLGAERDIITGQIGGHPIDDLEPVLDPETVVAHQAAVRTVHLERSVLDYLLAVVRGTREHPEIALGASPRGSLAISRAAQAHALYAGRDFVTPDDVKAVAPSALAHRIFPAGGRLDSTERARELVEQLLTTLPAPIGPTPPGAGGQR